jgi:hypothetical protein
MVIAEKVKDCKFVKEGFERNGHDCWGNYEYSSYLYVWVGNKKENVYDNMFIIHNEKEVLKTAYDWNLNEMVYEAKKELGFKLQLKLDLEF